MKQELERIAQKVAANKALSFKIDATGMVYCHNGYVCSTEVEALFGTNHYVIDCFDCEEPLDDIYRRENPNYLFI